MAITDRQLIVLGFAVSAGVIAWAWFGGRAIGDKINEGANSLVKGLTGGAAAGGEDTLGGVAARVREWLSGDDARIREMLKGAPPIVATNPVDAQNSPFQGMP
jgi:hypothetical protein